MAQPRDRGATRAIPDTSRRAMLTGATAALLAGAAIACQAKGATPGQMPAFGPAGADAGLIELADQIMALDALSDRLERTADQIEDWPEKERFMRGNIEPLLHQHWELMDQLARARATTLEGYRAKARVLQRFNNCAPGYAYPADNDALAWSLANDLLGVESVWRQDEGEEDRA